jgi:hypothetical protein
MSLSFPNVLTKLLHWIEMLIALAVTAFVVIGGVQLFRLAVNSQQPDSIATFSVAFEGSLSALLLLIVGVELIAMLVFRSPERLLEVMFFVIARKALIKTDHVYEVLLAVLAIAILFGVRRYLLRTDARPMELAGVVNTDECQGP